MRNTSDKEADDRLAQPDLSIPHCGYVRRMENCGQDVVRGEESCHPCSTRCCRRSHDAGSSRLLGLGFGVLREVLYAHTLAREAMKGRCRARQSAEC